MSGSGLPYNPNYNQMMQAPAYNVAGSYLQNYLNGGNAASLPGLMPMPSVAPVSVGNALWNPNPTPSPTPIAPIPTPVPAPWSSRPTNLTPLAGVDPAAALARHLGTTVGSPSPSPSPTPYLPSPNPYKGGDPIVALAQYIANR